MRIFFYSIFLIFALSISSFVAVDSITGQLVNTPNCSGGNTYAFYRTLQEKTTVETMWQNAGFIVVADEKAPASFARSGYTGFLCLKRMTKQEMGQVQQLQRPRVVTPYYSNPTRQERERQGYPRIE